MTAPYSEADTRAQLIDQQLRLAGWDVADPTQIQMELALTETRSPGTGRAVDEGMGDTPRQGPDSGYEIQRFVDYALMLRGLPAAVIEAKKTARDAQLGQEQAKQYAELIERNHGGRLPLVLYTNGYDIFFWDSARHPPARVPGFPTREDLEWLRQRQETAGALSAELIDTRVAGRDYQIEAIRTILDGIEAGRRKFLLVMATGTGKTRTATALVDVLQRAHWVKRVLFLVDRVALQEQALGAFKEHLPASPLWPREGDRGFARDRRVYVTTYPTMLNLINGGTTPENWVSPFFFDLIIADESHRSIFNIYQQVIQYFHGMTLGLTATPRDHVDHNTFALFDRPVHDPTFAYTFEEAIAHDPPYLSDFEVLKVKTRFQVEGIRGPNLDAEGREQLELEGLDPEAIDFEGTDLELKVSNAPTNAVIVREFMEESIKDEGGVLPGKSIIFAVSVKHARRLQELFDQLYPEHRGRLARVLVSDDSRVHGKGGLLDQFKNQDMPRVAISVDMLDTGVDIPEVVNLVFAKPVYSYVKFWQMLGRGTRILDADPARRKAWCREKDRFLVIDCWGNFEYFEMHPKGREPGTQVPMPVRLFRARLDQLEIALRVGNSTAIELLKGDLRADLAALPSNNVVVREHQANLARVSAEAYWQRLDRDTLRFLRSTIAPILRAQSEGDPKSLRFQIDVVDLGSALLSDNTDACTALKDSIQEQVSELPLTVNLVARERALIEAVLGDAWWATLTQDQLRDLSARLAPLMRFRQEDRRPILSLNLADITAHRERIQTGPDGRDLPIVAYRQRVEQTIRQMVATNPVLQRLQLGEPVSAEDLRQLASLLAATDPSIDEEKLRRVYDVRQADFVRLIRHVLGVEPLERWSTFVTRVFDEFIAGHTTFSALQIRFLHTLRTFILQRGRAGRSDLVEAPFTQIHPAGVRGVFSGPAMDEVMRFVDGLVA